MTPLRFDEDSYDPNEYRKTLEAARDKKSRIKRMRRNISIGKILMAVAALIISVALFYFASIILPTF